jgi:hypothetical protein
MASPPYPSPKRQKDKKSQKEKRAKKQLLFNSYARKITKRKKSGEEAIFPPFHFYRRTWSFLCYLLPFSLLPFWGGKRGGEIKNT